MPSIGTAHGGVRRAQSLPSDSTASGTGINHWWRYQEQSLPGGGGRMMVNVGTGNLLVQQDDMSVPHKGIMMAFRRTYNSQSPPTFSGDLASYSTMYGNGWTNTFDAHLVRTSPRHFSVFDIDGARYDYVMLNGQSISSSPGDHSQLTYDGACGVTWTKKSGTIYYFYNSSQQTGCPQIGAMGGYAGRLYQIIGRNRNTYLTFSYAWDNGDASVTGKIAIITATTESGMAATLSFADVNGRRLLQSLTEPDGTGVRYFYDANGNLVNVMRPPNNASGNAPMLSLGYTTIGSDQILYNYSSPRWCSNPTGCGYDGAWVLFLFNGTSAATSTFAEYSYAATLNPTINDGTNTPLYPGYQPAGLNYSNLRTEFYTTGVTTPTYRDTDGHMTNWVVDGLGRPTQTQECTASANQGQQCTGTWLLTNEGWDADNNLVSETDARGYETDYAYDTNGNTIAVGEPARTTSEGTFRPTRLYDYDANNNVLAYCDESETNPSANWASTPSPSDTLCSSLSAPHAQFAYSHPTYEPYGELTTITTALGYNRRIGYDLSKQGGTDYGLPTSVSGDPITQLDGTTVTPSQNFWYDTNGSVRCYSKGVGTWVLSYDANNRMTAVADPDDSSMNTSSLCGKTSGQAGWNTQTTFTYYPDGSKATVQSPSERAFGVSTSYTYDLDGNELTETSHHGCVPGQSCADGTTKKWYDGADRLIEAGLPHDARSFPITGMPYDHGQQYTRYVYDITAGGTVTVGTSPPFQAYGNLYETLIGAGTSAGWLEKAGSQFDALDRETAKFSWTIPSPGPSIKYTTTLQVTQLLYDQDPYTLGLLAKKIDPLNESVTYQYDSANKVKAETYAGDNGATPNETYLYDAVGRTATVSSTQFGSLTNVYDEDGRLASVTEPNGGGVTDPAQIQYSYYANGERSAVSVTSPTFNQSNALAFSYRADGLVQTQSLNAFASGSWNRQYTDAGRPTTTTGVDARTRSYDSTGQLQSDTIRGNLATYSYDPEGSQLTAILPNYWPQFNTTTYTYNARGELVDSIAGAVQYANDFRMIWLDNACGSRIKLPPDGSYDSNLSPNAADERSCATISSGNMGYADYNGYSYQDGATTNVQYDVAGRAVHKAATAASFFAPDQVDLVPETQTRDGAAPQATPTPAASATPVPSFGFAPFDMTGSTVNPVGGHAINPGSSAIKTVATSDTAYDAENRTVQQSGSFTRQITRVNAAGAPIATPTPAPSPSPTTQVALGWGPNGHPVLAYGGTSIAMTYHWDGDTILFVSDVNGNVIDFKAGFDGEVTPQDSTRPGLIVMDRDRAGLVIDTTTSTNNYYMPPDEVGSPQESWGSLIPPYAPYYRTDGFYVGSLQINGGRAYDPVVQQWSTPDAYEGDIDDPVSQQRYMWNRNNAIDYADPSGYDPDNSAVDRAEGKAQLQVIGHVLARPYIDPRVAANALDMFNPPGMRSRHTPNLGGFLGSSALAAASEGGLAGRMEVHHWLPQAFRRFFESKGINIEEYTTKMPWKNHRGKGKGVHYVPENYNAAWKAWIRENQGASARDVIDHLNKMTLDPYGVFFDNPF